MFLSSKKHKRYETSNQCDGTKKNHADSKAPARRLDIQTLIKKTHPNN